MNALRVIGNYLLVSEMEHMYCIELKLSTTEYKQHILKKKRKRGYAIPRTPVIVIVMFIS